jgi:hypothetical protein
MGLLRYNYTTCFGSLEPSSGNKCLQKFPSNYRIALDIFIYYILLYFDGQLRKYKLTQQGSFPTDCKCQGYCHRLLNNVFLFSAGRICTCGMKERHLFFYKWVIAKLTFLLLFSALIYIWSSYVVIEPFLSSSLIIMLRHAKSLIHCFLPEQRTARGSQDYTAWVP